MAASAPDARRRLLRDCALAVLLLLVGMLSQQLDFLVIDGARVLWMGGGLLVGVLAVRPPRRWWVFVVAFVIGSCWAMTLTGWPPAAVAERTVLDAVVVVGLALVLRRTGWLLMREPAHVWALAGLGLLTGLVRALGMHVVSLTVDSPVVVQSAQASVVVLSTVLALLTAAPLVAMLVAMLTEPRTWTFRAATAGPVLARTAAVLGGLIVVLILAGPVVGDIRMGVLQFPILAFAAMTLPGVVVAAVLLFTSLASVAVMVAYLTESMGQVGGLTLDPGALTVVPVVAVALMSWILFAIRASERQASRRISAIMDSLLDPHVLMTPIRDASGAVVDFRMLDANDAGARDHGVARDVLLRSTLGQVSPAELAEGMLPLYADVLDTGRPMVLDGHVMTDDARGGEQRAFDLRAVRMADGLVVTWRDVTDREQEAAELARREHQYRLLAENAMDLVFFIDPDDTVRWVSPSVGAGLGYAPDDLIGRSVRMLVHPQDQAPAVRDVNPSGPTPTMGASRVRLRTQSGDYVWYEVTIRCVNDDSGQLTGGVAAARDIDAEVRAARELERELSFDSLTGLARRPLAVRRLQEELDRRPAHPVTVMVAGIDRLTVVNSAYGFHGGDRVLQAVGERLVQAAGAHDRVARITGDEFAILLPDLDDPATAASAARRLLDAVRGPVDAGGGTVDVTVSIGIAQSAEQSAETLLADATTAMWQATARGADRWEFLDGDVGAVSRRALERQGLLRVALAEDRVRAWFMPIVDLASGRVRGYEALARCIDPDGSVCPPADFLPAAELSGSVLDVDRVILDQALDALTALPADLHIAVNVSGTSLAVGGLARRTSDRLREVGIAPHRLHLEVTETALVHVTPSVAAEMAELAQLGVVWWVDDFGTGFSSISHLRDLPIGGLKLDRSFTAEVTDLRGRGTSLAEGLAGLAAGLDLLTVAEGIEDEVQARALAAQGWVHGQGYLYGAPAPLEVAAGVPG